MKNFKFLTLISILILITSCSRDDGTSPPTNCFNAAFFALRTDNYGNTNQELNLAFAYSNNLNIATIPDAVTISNSDTYGSSKSAYDVVSEYFYFIDEFNGGSRMIKAGTGSSTVGLSFINLFPNSSYTAPVIDNGILYAIEQDNTNNLYLVTIDQIFGVTTRVSTTPIANFNIQPDPFGTKCYGTSNENGKLYFLGDKLMVVDVSGTTPIYTYFNKPTNAAYVDIIHHHDAVDSSISSDGLFVAMVEQGGTRNGIVHWDLSSGPINERDIKTDLNINLESTSLAYNICGDRLVVLSNSVYNGTTNDLSKVWDLQIPNNVLSTPNSATLVAERGFSEFFFGIIQKD